MALRGAWLLRPPDDTRVELFKKLRRGYNLRSSIAHGSLGRELTEEELVLTSGLEDALRQLIKLYLDAPSCFEPSVLNRLTLGVNPRHSGGDAAP